jgi:hypothetical protein
LALCALGGPVHTFVLQHHLRNAKPDWKALEAAAGTGRGILWLVVESNLSDLVPDGAAKGLNVGSCRITGVGLVGP